MAFGLEAQGMSAATSTGAWRPSWAAGADDVAGRPPTALSLEQRRRLALARALAPEPHVLLLDEPLAHLDPIARKTLRIELAKLHRDLAVTTIHVTRDAADALALSDRLAVMNGGRVEQLGDPPDVYQHPRTRAVAEALGPANFLPVRVVEVRDLGVVVETEGGHRVRWPGSPVRSRQPAGLLVLRPEILSMTDAARPAAGCQAPCPASLRGRASALRVDIGGTRPCAWSCPPTREPFVPRRRARPGELSSDTVVLVPDDYMGAAKWRLITWGASNGPHTPRVRSAAGNRGAPLKFGPERRRGTRCARHQPRAPQLGTRGGCGYASMSCPARGVRGGAVDARELLGDLVWNCG